MNRTIITLTIAGVLLSACHRVEVPPTKPLEEKLTVVEKQEMMQRFGAALSIVVAESRPVRKLLKEKALEQFDKNFDVLWGVVKDTLVGEKTFQELMIEKTSAAFMDSIHLGIPLLNILFPDLPFFSLHPLGYSTTDNELPVVVPSPSLGLNLLYYNGELTDRLRRGLVPDFYVLVINENNRVRAFPKLRSGSLEGYGYSFISPAFDGRHPQTKAVATAPDSLIGSKAIEAFQYFYKEDTSINSMALQRDYIYYGLTPEKPSGPINSIMSEYLTFIEMDPKAFFKIADQPMAESTYEDPVIKESTVSRKKRDFTQEELIDALWTKGAYNLRVEILSSTGGTPKVLYIPVFPSELWDFNLEKTYQNNTFFRRSKYTYHIDPNKFTTKRYVLEPYSLCLGGWDLSTGSVYKHVSFIEEDENEEISKTVEYETTRMKASQFDGNLKLDVGLAKFSVEAGVSVKTDHSNTTKDKHTITVKRKVGSDDLGMDIIYFYDPIIKKRLSDGTYEAHVYNTGNVTFGVSAY